MGRRWEKGGRGGGRREGEKGGEEVERRGGGGEKGGKGVERRIGRRWRDGERNGNEPQVLKFYHPTCNVLMKIIIM